ncbi:MAG: ABC transporter ATP-binding protein/permease [Lachnospiraceae bacterium]|nr:ABC transporter ATP-binding protein/permease [Lachnospiraceae bacterium]
MKGYFKYMKPYLPFFIIGPILMLTEVAGEIFLPRLMQMSIDNGINAEPQSTGYVLMMGGLMVLTAFVMMVGGVGGNFMSVKASASFAADLRKDVYGKVQEFSFKNIDTFSTGSLVTRLTNDVTQLQNMLRMCLVMLLRAPGMLIGGIIMAFSYNAQLAAIIIAIIPLLGIVIGIMIKVAFPRFSIMQEKLDRLNSTVQEGMTNVRVIKSFVRRDFEEKRFDNANLDLKQNSMAAMRIMILTMPFMTLLMNLTTLLVVGVAGRKIIVGDMTVGTLSAFTTYIVQILMSFMMLAMIILQSSRALASSRRIREVLDTEVDLNDSTAKQRGETVKKGSIEFRNVSFKYYLDREEKVLENISFSVQPGETVGIIGSTGAGKTSLVQLIPRLYDATEGEVLVDGVDVRDYSLKNLREGVGMVLQKNVLFSGTIEENLKWGDENATQEEIRAAAGAAQADTFVSSFTDGYATELGQGGVNVSGGQKQRLCIARALLKKPKILILDDSTSAVDTATEAKIRESFSGSLKDTTKLIIAQRISSVIEADKIIVLEEGKIVGMGRHDELMADCGTYQEIYYSQRDKEGIA